MKQPKIILVISEKDQNKSIIFWQPDMIEMRVDLYPNLTPAFAIKQFQHRRKLNIPLLLTVRNDKKEGAQRSMTDKSKWELLEVLMPLTDWVDIELSSKLCAKTIALARKLKKKVIVSKHDFKSMPKDINILYRKAKAVKADGVKFAFNAKDEKDLSQMIEFTNANRKEMLVTMCVGTWGPLSRIVLPSFGSRWVYTFLNHSTAPGQLDIKTLSALL